MELNKLYKEFIKTVIDFNMSITRTDSILDWIDDVRSKFEDLLEDKFLYWWDEGTDYVAVFWLNKDCELESGLYRLPCNKFDAENGDDTEELISTLRQIICDDNVSTKTQLNALLVLKSFLEESIEEEEEQC